MNPNFNRKSVARTTGLRSTDLRNRVAAALGWNPDHARSFSFPALRELVRPVSPELAKELDTVIRTGSYITK